MKEPLLAPNEIPDLTKLVYPQIVMPKYDGIRCICFSGSLLSRNFKPLPNIRLRKHLECLRNISVSNGIVYDGELYSHSLTFQDIQSVVMSRDTPIPASLEYKVFDCLTIDQWESQSTERYIDRIALLNKHRGYPDYIQAYNPEQVTEYYERYLDQGYEGAILRNPNAPYKWGRATLNENIIYKLKQFETIDVKCLAVNPARTMLDNVERTRNATGHLEKVHTQDSYMPTDIAGSITVLLDNGDTCNVGFGKGFDNTRKKELLTKPELIVGKTVEILYQPVGVKNKPRMPKLVRIREDK